MLQKLKKKLKCKKGQDAAGWLIVGLVLLFGGGHYMYSEGRWGSDGEDAIKNCVGTHVNGNCAHMELNPAEVIEIEIADLEGIGVI